MKMKKNFISMESGSEKYQFLVMLKGKKNERMKKVKADEPFQMRKVICSWNETRNSSLHIFYAEIFHLTGYNQKFRLH